MSAKVLIGMSGGVDSTITSLMLQKSGYNVTGVYMKLHGNEQYHKENFTKAKKAADYLNIPIYFHDLSAEFKNHVYDYFIDSYKSGITPNPCIMCNRTIKFDAMIKFADSLGIENISTGHYVRTDGRFIYKALDTSKDQSYFMAEVKKEVIPRLIFPLGKWLKKDVKAYAASIPKLSGFASQKESSEICFVENEYIDVLQKHMKIDMKGVVLNANNQAVGEHKGYMHYTIGQRRGFTVDGAHDPHFVLSINPNQNEIVVGTKDALAKKEFAIKRINLFEDLNDFECEVGVRYRTKMISAKVTIRDGIGWVLLGEPVFGISKGQFAVFYDGDRLLGGGEIA